jgi:hypothetical protein
VLRASSVASAVIRASADTCNGRVT